MEELEEEGQQLRVPYGRRRGGVIMLRQHNDPGARLLGKAQDHGASRILLSDEEQNRNARSGHRIGNVRPGPAHGVCDWIEIVRNGTVHGDRRIGLVAKSPHPGSNSAFREIAVDPIGLGKRMGAAGGDAEVLDVDAVLVAVGRKPFTEGLGLEAAQILGKGRRAPPVAKLVDAQADVGRR